MRKKELCSNLRTCNKCEWIHFGVSRTYALDQVAEFNAYYRKLTKEEQMDFYGGEPSHLAQYERCFLCGNSHRDFHDTTKAEETALGQGHTIQPIINEELK